MKLETCVKFSDNWSTKCSASDKGAGARISGKKPIRITLWCHGSLQMLAHQKLRGLSGSINSFLPCSAKLPDSPLWFCTLNIKTCVSGEVICSVKWWQFRLKNYSAPHKDNKVKVCLESKHGKAKNRQKCIPQEAIQATLILQPSSNITLIAFDLHSLEAIRGVNKEIISPVWKELQRILAAYTGEKLWYGHIWHILKSGTVCHNAIEVQCRELLSFPIFTTILASKTCSFIKWQGVQQLLCLPLNNNISLLLVTEVLSKPQGSCCC